MLNETNQTTNKLISKGGCMKKFCWLPREIYSSRYYRDGFVWLGWVHKGIDGKWFRYPQVKPRAIFSSNGDMKYLYTPSSWVNDPLAEGLSHTKTFKQQYK